MFKKLAKILTEKSMMNLKIVVKVLIDFVYLF